jgi:hypothetical protein
MDNKVLIVSSLIIIAIYIFFTFYFKKKSETYSNTWTCIEGECSIGKCDLKSDNCFNENKMVKDMLFS